MRTLLLKPGRDAATRRRHPWLFAGAVAGEAGDGVDGLVEARGDGGGYLARGFASPRSPIVARWWTFADKPVDAGLVDRRLDDALDLRTAVVPPETDGYRVVNAEGDFLPGLVVDRYAGVLAVQATTEGTERARRLWLPALLSRFPGATILQKNGLPSRAAEGLATYRGRTSYFLGRETFVATGRSALPGWRRALFLFLARNACSPTEFFGIPPNEVVELGAQIEV